MINITILPLETGSHGDNVTIVVDETRANVLVRVGSVHDCCDILFKRKSLKVNQFQQFFAQYTYRELSYCGLGSTVDSSAIIVRSCNPVLAQNTFPKVKYSGWIMSYVGQQLHTNDEEERYGEREMFHG